MDTLTAARWQMTVSLIFHMVFAAIGIGLPLLLVLVERQYLRTGQQHYRALARKWAKAVGLLFAVGAISGTALSLELGLLWPKYMEVTGAVVGHLFGLEGFAFFVEAIFIGLYLYGWDRMSATAHWWCGVVIATSGMVSGLLILGVNSWMQIPVGFDAEAFKQTGRVLVSDPMAIFSRPLWLLMAVHSTLSCYIAVSFAVAGIYAWGWLRGRRDAYHASALKVSLAVGAIAAVLQPISGDIQAKYVYKTQPVKFAAMEGQFKSEAYAPLRIGGLPDEDRQTTDFAIEIPGGLSFLATGNPSAMVVGLNEIDRQFWPPVSLTHAAFQAMVGLGMFLVIAAIWYWIIVWRRRDSAPNRWLMWVLVIGGPMGFIALEAGWVVTEVGRQPWVIQGLLLTRDSVTPAGGVQAMFYGFSVLYAILTVTVIVLLRALAGGSEQAAAPQEVRSA